MPFYYLLALALIQGVTEFLPISSSGHLVLFHALTGGDGPDSWGRSLTLDVAVHVGTLFAVLVYFYKDVWLMLLGLPALLQRKASGPGSLMGFHIFISSMPVIIAGFILHQIQPGWLRSVEIMAWATLGFGILLWWADRTRPLGKTVQNMTALDALWIGLAQCLALIPGASRSGITMTAARFLGMSRKESAHYSLLLAIIAITGAATLTGIDLAEEGNIALTYDLFIAGFLAFIVGWVSIALMMKWLEKASFTVFAVYRVVLGGILLILIYTGALS